MLCEVESASGNVVRPLRSSDPLKDSMLATLNTTYVHTSLDPKVKALGDRWMNSNYSNEMDFNKSLPKFTNYVSVISNTAIDSTEL